MKVLGCFIVVVAAVFVAVYSQEHSKEKLKLLVVTVATEETDGYKRFVNSAKFFNLNTLVLGMNEEWVGGNLQYGVGGGQKINILRSNIEKYKNEKNLVIMFTDSYDVVFAGDESTILNKFLSMNSRMVFSAEKSLWPDKTLADKYPTVEKGNRFLCSGGFIGYAKEFWTAVSDNKVQNTDDDQLYYTHVYLNETLRKLINATLDHTSTIFQNINYAQDEIEFEAGDDFTVVKNSKYVTYPLVLHGNGPSKIYLNHIGNYVPDGWHPSHPCRSCKSDMIELAYEDEESIPHIMVALFIEEPTPFIQEFFDAIANLDYLKSRISLFVHAATQSTEKPLSKFLIRYRSLYNAVETIPYYKQVDDWTARNMAVDHCLMIKCDYMLSIDSIVRITDSKLLKTLLTRNKQVVAPLVKKEGQLWSNFWGALNVDGFYARSEDYIPIVNYEKIGLWNVPFISSIYLVKGSTLENLVKKVPQPFINDKLDSDMAFCHNLREQYIFMYILNEDTYGRLLQTDNLASNQLHPDLWQIEDNKKDWEEKYIHPKFWENIDPNTTVNQPCPDVYAFPLMSDAMADQLVETADKSNLWSSGKNEDPRIAGGYENVPTIDIHMNQIGFEKQWLHFLREYVVKVVEKVYPGFYTKARSTMMFMVRYRPNEQPSLRPHHDSSTWTINVALNRKNIDFEGGGCRFLRYNCSVVDLPKGWALLHPGRLTHYHEGLLTTNGTRYIFVSFVDP